MYRRHAAALSFALAAVAAGCGHQVTPDPSQNNLAGNILIRFKTSGAMNFDRYDYQIVLDACGGGTPYPQAGLTTFTDYTYSFNIGQTPAGPSVTTPLLLQYVLTPGTSNQLNPQIVRTSVSQITLTPNDNGQNNEFTLVFPRALLVDPLGPTAFPCHSSLVSPAPASPTPTNAPTTGATASPSTAASTLAGTWKFNFFVIDQGSRQVVDSLGSGGPTDSSYNNANIDTTTQNFNPISKIPDNPAPPADTAAQLSGGEIDNYL